MNLKNGLNPLVNKNTNILVLGSFPGKSSLSSQKYYSNDENIFWDVMFKFSKNTPVASYRKRVKMIREQGVGIWNLIKTCIRKGSLDKDIKQYKLNDLKHFLSKHKSISTIILNGGKAKEIYYKHYRSDFGVEIYCLPSTSSRNTINKNKLIEKWVITLLKNTNNNK